MNDRLKVFLKVEPVPEMAYTRFNIIFRDTGEIRQKIVSDDFLLRRVFMNELKRWEKELNENLIYDPLFEKPGAIVSPKWRGKIDMLSAGEEVKG